MHVLAGAASLPAVRRRYAAEGERVNEGEAGSFSSSICGREERR
jgi:hypothetical protein